MRMRMMMGMKMSREPEDGLCAVGFGKGFCEGLAGDTGVNALLKQTVATL